RDFHVTGVQTCALPILGEREIPTPSPERDLLKNWTVEGETLSRAAHHDSSESANDETLKTTRAAVLGPGTIRRQVSRKSRSHPAPPALAGRREISAAPGGCAGAPRG